MKAFKNYCFSDILESSLLEKSKQEEKEFSCLQEDSEAKRLAEVIKADVLMSDDVLV